MSRIASRLRAFVQGLPPRDGTTGTRTVPDELNECLACRKQMKFDPNQYKRYGFVSKKAVSMFNDICNPDVDGATRYQLLRSFASIHNMRSSDRFIPDTGTHDVGTHYSDQEEDKGDKRTPWVLLFWILEDNNKDNHKEHGIQDAMTFKFSPRNHSIQYPITMELPHVDMPVGKRNEASMEGLLDTGGACTMGNIHYWREVAARAPSIVASFEELSQHQEKLISIGGVGAGRVVITHVMGLWLPWTVAKEDTKLVVGLGDNMLMTLLIGLPFQIAAQS